MQEAAGISRSRKTRLCCTCATPWGQSDKWPGPMSQ